ncbi:FUSC family protein [Amycolatopsis sp. NPDC049252]|uniref:FUSC family protein n=1 Tax=Amycolatopsis sp. NPDC049252 TaxID=3363933 RepID=UPI003710DF28
MVKGLVKGVGMLVFIVAVVGATAGIGVAAGLGNTVVLAGLTALFCFIAATGGPLRSDLVLLAGYAPVVVAGVAGPRLLGAVSDVAAIALLTVVVFTAALLPALGPRFVTVGLGLGMASVFGYGFQLTGTASAGQIIGAPALAAGVAIVLRLLLGIGDPGKPTREALADALAGGGRDTAERAVRLWLADRPRKWQTRVLGAGARARATASVLDDRRRTLTEDQATALGTILDAADAELVQLAEAVRAKDAPDEVVAATRPDLLVDLPGETRRLVDELWSGVDAVREAVLTRDESVVDIPRRAVRTALRHEAEGALSWRSAQLRHAVRCALGMLLALVVARFRPGDPLTVSFLMTTFAVLQPEWRDTLSKAWQRVGGALGGAVVLALVLWLLPHDALLPIALVALLAGFPLMRSKPTVFNGCMVLLSVGMNAATKHLDARTLLVEYVLLMVLAVAIALLFGFAAVPGVRKPSLAERFTEAVDATRALLTAVAATLRDDPAGRRELGVRFRAAARAQQDLRAPEPGSKPPEAGQQAALDSAAEGLRGLAASAGALLLRGGSGPMAGFTASAAQALRGSSAITAPDEPLDEEQRLVADTVIADVLRVRHAAPALGG